MGIQKKNLRGIVHGQSSWYRTGPGFHIQTRPGHDHDHPHHRVGHHQHYRHRHGRVLVAHTMRHRLVHGHRQEHSRAMPGRLHLDRDRVAVHDMGLGPRIRHGPENRPLHFPMVPERLGALADLRRAAVHVVHARMRHRG